MALAALGFVDGSVCLLFAALFLLGVPVDPFRAGEVQHPAAAAAEEELVGGNALVETGTFVAICSARSRRRC